MTAEKDTPAWKPQSAEGGESKQWILSDSRGLISMTLMSKKPVSHDELRMIMKETMK